VEIAVITENDLRAAGAAIGDMPATDVERRLRQLKERRRARSELAELSDLAELDTAELERSAYELAREYQDNGNLRAAARWYSVAAANDYGDASFELAKVLDTLAGRQRDLPASQASKCEELDLVEGAARWYSAAYGAGHPESAELLDALIARHDPSLPRAERPSGSHLGSLYAGEVCPLGGLMRVMQGRLTAASVHVGTCRPCQKELLDHGGILPIVHKNQNREA
jgi:TPR repeat protein